MNGRALSMLLAASAAAVLMGCADSGTDHNTADVTFATDMIPHHRQAVAMAELAESRTENPDVRGLAAAIRAGQGPEIETMSGWLEEWGEPVPTDMGSMDSAGMPGMMSAQQMTDLAAARGSDFDETFLESMIAHHNGAIEMARAEQADGRYTAAIDLAEQVVRDQSAEIDTMQRLRRS